MTDFHAIREHAGRVCDLLEEKGKGYGTSWCRRGGAGAFFSMSRKWDRIEHISQGLGYDILEAGRRNEAGVLDDIDDLIGYLLLIREKVDAPKNVFFSLSDGKEHTA